MKEEIKEILEALDSVSCCKYHDDMCKKAKNYIIDLQNENVKFDGGKYYVCKDK